MINGCQTAYSLNIVYLHVCLSSADGTAWFRTGSTLCLATPCTTIHKVLRQNGLRHGKSVSRVVKGLPRALARPNHVVGPPWTPPYPLALQALTFTKVQAGTLPPPKAIMPCKSGSGARRTLGKGTMAENLDIVNPAVSLLVRAALLAARHHEGLVLGPAAYSRVRGHRSFPPQGRRRRFAGRTQRRLDHRSSGAGYAKAWATEAHDP
jgi:hypothetical protein